ncbi:MAG: hypothetical protein K2X86_08660 [Cytophagaceae bacterium]|nr:hypothetical protein [Cytophagaceae bacterium]
MMKVISTIVLLFIFINPLFGQKLFIGIGAGPDRTYNVIKGNIPSSVAKFNNRLSVAEFIYLEYLLNKRFSIKGALRNTSLGYDFGVTQSNAPPGTICFTHSIIGFNFPNFEIAFKNRFKIFSERLMFTQSLGFVWMPVFSPYEDGGGTLGCAAYGPELTFNNKSVRVQNFCVNSTIGLEYRIYKNCHLTLEVNYNKCFKEIDYIDATSTVNGNNYYSRISSYGNYGAVHLGVKLPFPGQKKEIPVTMKENHSPRMNDTVEQDRGTGFYNKGDNFVGFSVRPLDKYSGLELLTPLNPLKNLSFSIRYFYFVRDKFAVGIVGYYKSFTLRYSGNKDKEILGGIFSRYYFFKTKNSIFSELNVTAGSYVFLKPSIVVIGGLGYSRLLRNNLSFESSFKLMIPHASDYPLIELNPINMFVDFGLNYHF